MGRQGGEAKAEGAKKASKPSRVGAHPAPASSAYREPCLCPLEGTWASELVRVHCTAPDHCYFFPKGQGGQGQCQLPLGGLIPISLWDETLQLVTYQPPLPAQCRAAPQACRPRLALRTYPGPA